MDARTLIAALGLLFAPLAGAAEAQQVSRAEHDRLRTALDSLRLEFEQSLDLLDAQRDSINALQSGTTRFVLTGYGSAVYSSTRRGPSTFTAEFVPILLWQLSERILFSAEPEFELEEELEVELEYAHLSVLVTDFLTVGAGKFLTPFAIFGPRLHAAWINKLPTSPLAFTHDGLAPISSVGAYARGGIPLGSARASYAAYVINAPELMTEGHDAGLVEFGDASQERALGGRLGLFLLRTGLEVGYSYQTSEVAVLHGIDLSFARMVQPLGGAIDVRVEAVRSSADDGPFTDEDEPEPMWLVNNRRDGGYAQVAYRPSLAKHALLQDLEVVMRFERMDRPGWIDGPAGNDTNRYTVGLNYLLTPSTRIKAAFERTNHTLAENASVLLLQTAIGF